MSIIFRSLNAGDCDVTLCPDLSDAPARPGVFDESKLALKPVKRDWTTLLKRTIETEIIPHILSAQRDNHAGLNPAAAPGHPRAADVAAFVDLIIADEMEQVRAVADRVIVMTGGRDALLHELLTPAAQLLGQMWERDVCDFTTVTLGVYRLDQIMKETCTSAGDDYNPVAHDRTILLVPAPGEQHSFGLNMVADIFREGGWCVRSCSRVSRVKLVDLVGQEWFDVMGFSVSSDRALKGLPAAIRAVRQASCNPQLGIFVGGRAIIENPERTRFLGANGSANDPRQALRDANKFADATVTERLHQSKTKLVDIG